jgi:triosephosphate isomerase (TIM)
MTPGVRPLVAGNWKMNGLSGSLIEIEEMRLAAERGEAGAAELAVCPPATLIAHAASKLKGSKLALGAQDCHTEASGAFTGDIAAPMLKDAGAAYVIVGHSERRALHHETDDLVRAKAEAALNAGLTAIVCVGETRDEREAGQASAVVTRQLKGSLPPAGAPATLVIAYEPVWAIGTGLTPTPADVAEMHQAIRTLLGEIYGTQGSRMRILYGGSVKPTNCGELLTVDNVDGALVGGASLKAKDFLAIAAAYREARPAYGPFQIAKAVQGALREPMKSEAMTDRAKLIDEIITVMRDCWDLPADCNEGELFAYAEELFDRIEAGDPRGALYAYLDNVQTDKLEMPKSPGFREIVDRSVALIRNHE